MLDTIQLYINATLAVAIMGTLSVISGFIAAGLTDDRTLVVGTIVVVFTLTGAALLLRLWLMTQQTATPRSPSVDD
jgi:hypothetical protein